MARLLLVRHGQSAWNAESRWQGWADPPLSDLGEAQAAALAATLVPGRFQGVVSSDLQRARRTAAIVAGDLGLGVDTDPALRERDVGAWMGLSTAEIERRWPHQLRAWRSGALASPPEGESDDTMAVRVMATLTRLLGRPEDSLLVFTHKGVIRMVERRLGLDQSAIANMSGRWLHAGPGGHDGHDGNGSGSITMVAGGPFLPELDAGDGPLPTVTDGADAR